MQDPKDKEYDYGYGKQFEIFSHPVKDFGSLNTKWIPHLPTAALTEQGAIQFQISPTDKNYIDLKRCYLSLKVKVIDGKGNPLPKIDYNKSLIPPDKRNGVIGAVQNFMHSLISQVDVTLNGKKISTSDGNYPYKAYLDNVFCNSSSRACAMKEAALFYEDDLDQITDLHPIFSANQGINERSKYLAESNEFDMCGPILSDVFSIDRYMLNTMQMNVTLWPTKPKFHLVTKTEDAEKNKDGWRTIITAASLYVCYITPSSQMNIAHDKLLKENNFAMYPYYYQDSRTMTIAQNSRHYTMDNVFQNKVPASIVIAMLPTIAYTGSYDTNPYFFKHYNLQSVKISLDNDVIGGNVIENSFKDTAYKSQYAQSFFSLFNDGKEDMLITRKAFYLGGFALYQINTDSFLRDDNQGNIIPSKRRGNIRIDLKFDENTPENITLLVFGKFPKTIKVDESRNVIIED